MTDIFVDGIRSIAVANGVTRVELVQLRRGSGEAKLEPEVVARLLVPVGALKDLAAQLAKTVHKIEESARAQAESAAGAAVDSALENL